MGYIYYFLGHFAPLKIFLNFNFEIIRFTRSCIDCTERSHLPFTQVASLVIFYIVTVQYRDQELVQNCIYSCVSFYYEQVYLNIAPIQIQRGTWLAQLEEHVTLDFRAVSSSPTLDLEIFFCLKTCLKHIELFHHNKDLPWGNLHTPDTLFLTSGNL